MRRLRIAYALVRLYPRTWRRRYEAEMRALLAERPPDLFGLIDLFLGCGSEWGRTLSDPVAYPHLSGIPFSLFQTVLLIGAGVSLGILTGVSGEWLRQIIESPETLAGLPIGVFVYMAVAIRFFVAVKSRAEVRYVGAVEARCWLAAIFVFFTIERWAGPLHGPVIEQVRTATCLWFLAMATRQNRLMLETHQALRRARLAEYRMRLLLLTAERHADERAGSTPELEAARADLATVQDCIRQHASALRRLGPLAVLGLREP